MNMYLTNSPLKNKHSSSSFVFVVSLACLLGGVLSQLSVVRPNHYLRKSNYKGSIKHLLPETFFGDVDYQNSHNNNEYGEKPPSQPLPAQGQEWQQPQQLPVEQDSYSLTAPTESSQSSYTTIFQQQQQPSSSSYSSDSYQQASDRSYSSTSSPDTSYGAPSQPDSSYGSPSSPQPDSSYGAPPSQPDSSYGTPSTQLDTSYGAPSSPQSDSYGPPQQSSATGEWKPLDINANQNSIITEQDLNLSQCMQKCYIANL